MPDIEVIESKLNFLREYLGDLEEYETISLSAYRKNKKDLKGFSREIIQYLD